MPANCTVAVAPARLMMMCGLIRTELPILAEDLGGALLPGGGAGHQQ